MKFDEQFFFKLPITISCFLGKVNCLPRPTNVQIGIGEFFDYITIIEL